MHLSRLRRFHSARLAALPLVAMTIGAGLAGCAAGTGVEAAARPPMSEDQAVARAVDILRGTDYGDTYPGIVGRIKDRQLLTSGSNDCGPITTPVWAFRFQFPHDGWLYVDARTGAKACSSLPFIR